MLVLLSVLDFVSAIVQEVPVVQSDASIVMVVLSLLLGILVCAKYQDKAARGRT